MPPKREVKKVNGDGWIKQVSLGNLLSISSIFVGLTGFYFTTNSNFEAQAKAIAAIERRISDADKKEERKETQQISERENLRKDVTDLSKQTAVLSSQLTTTNTELVKLGQKIDAIFPLPSRR